jgi:steroid delta-isomerase-like uncharacterized protein
MSLEKNKAIVLKLFEAENKKDLALMDELIASDYVDHAFQLKSLDSYKQMFKMTIDGFPDIHETIGDIVAEGDRVWVRFKATGTHTGEYRGIAPTGKKITIKGIIVLRIVDGKIVEKESGVYDFLDFYKQLGVIEYDGFPDEDR